MPKTEKSSSMLPPIVMNNSAVKELGDDSLHQSIDMSPLRNRTHMGRNKKSKQVAAVHRSA